MQAIHIPSVLLDTGRLLAYCGRRFLADGGPRTAAALSYSSLLALVPMMAVGFAILTAFNAFQRERGKIQSLVLEALPSDVGLAVSQHFATFLENTDRMTAIGVIGLGLVALLLLNTITGGLNDIWRVSQPRPLLTRFLVYWALLTLGPLLLGASLSFSGYAFAAVEWSGVAEYTPGFLNARLAPFAFAALGFTLMFLVVPNRAVRPRHALAGALVAAFIFELLKGGFGFYLRHFPAYQVIYGTLAAIPIFLLWMYLSWAVVLLGAELAAALPEWRAAGTRRRRGGEPGAELALALSLLLRLRAASREGRILREATLAQGLPATLSELDHVLRALRQDGFVTRAGRRWVLSRDLSTVTLDELVGALGLSFEPGEGWPETVVSVLGSLSATGADLRARSLADLLSVAAEPATPARVAAS